MLRRGSRPCPEAARPWCSLDPAAPVPATLLAALCGQRPDPPGPPLVLAFGGAALADLPAAVVGAVDDWLDLTRQTFAPPAATAAR